MISPFARSVVDELGPLVPKPPDPDKPTTLLLRNNENPFGTEHCRYPGFGDDAILKLPESYLDWLRLAEQTHHAASLALNASNIVLTTGAAGALEQVCKAFFEPGVDRIALTPPCFGVFSRLAAIHRIEVVQVPLLGPAYDRLDVDALCESQVKGVILCDPNNPVGSRLNQADIELLLMRFRGLVIIDEAYVEYSRKPSNLRRLEAFPRLLILRTMSKALGMAGLRIGAAIGAEGLIEPLRRVQLPFAISSVAANAAHAVLADPASIMRGIEQFRRERDTLYQALAALPCVSAIWGDDCGFISIRTRAFNKMVHALRVCRIEPLFNPEGLHDCIRFSIGTASENERVIRVLESIN
ncbi:aminotransferase class I/II-fold pyridoxal phosphate-dependent enzyme [Caballeronia sp. LZ034LL]|uniref:aminotransferase class I/II-fold pyridoxal phosphate-dependent enzyme n=1 Tax=Caballeronia sp. LZ034LL TaxID=3038567 RepID=UPI002859D075|nr:aminotransferase class I/II-fold pyridoxal phosphate-dependent enzyme [Caballeronia sp. LZ034LL]MDR5838673.1 aminotransferase class I/II-fold pyridoxal phosphate-dependent enzyme [Caballeronia sp. LZ034LL]